MAESDDDQKGSVKRRGLLAAAGVATVGATGWFGYRAWQSHKPVPPPTTRLQPDVDRGFYRRLGRTDLEVSAVSIGGGGVSNPKVIARAIDAGLNFIDTSICYGDSELVIAEMFRQRPELRQKLVLATKWDVAQDMPKSRILESLDKSLQRLGVEQIDIMQLHWLGGGHVRGDDGFNRLDNEALYAAMEEVKKAGKVRFFGATSHHENRGKILEHAVGKGAYDMLLVKMNALDFDGAGIPSLLSVARKADVGVVAMKSQPDGGRMPPGFEEKKWGVYQANLRWVLQHDVATVINSDIGEDPEMQDLAIEAAREPFTEADRALLEQYTTAVSPHYCRGCDSLCGGACPEGVSIAAVMQFAMYHEAYGWPARARQHYRNLPVAERFAERCLSCSQCSDACPHGLDPAGTVRWAAETLGDGGSSRA